MNNALAEPFYVDEDDGKVMLRPADIVIGSRFRKNKGKLAALKKSIEDVGQLQPVLVDRECNLIAGWRRVTALREMGRDVEVTIAADEQDAAAKLRAERDENTCREPFTPAEALALSDAIKAAARPAARARQRAGHAAEGNGDSRNLREGRTDEQGAKATGRSASTLRKIEKIKTVAFDQDAPEAARIIAQSAWDQCENDPDAKIHPLYKELMAALKPEVAHQDPPSVSLVPDPEPQDEVFADVPEDVEATITDRVGEMVAVLGSVSAQLDGLYADEDFRGDNVAGPIAHALGEILRAMLTHYENATAPTALTLV